MGVTALAYPGINFIYYLGYEDLTKQPDKAKCSMPNPAWVIPFSFPEVWHTVAYAFFYFSFHSGRDDDNADHQRVYHKTHRQNIIDGWSHVTSL